MFIDDYIEYHDKYTKKYGDKTLILIQCGSFFEAYAIDNEKDKFNAENMYHICDIMNIQLSRKNKKIIENSRHNPLMAGFPLVAIDKFIQILLNNKYTIVLIEQVTEPPEPERKVTNIFSPGTNINYCSSEDTSNLVSIYIESVKNMKSYKENILVGLSVIDLPTGKSIVYETYSNNDDQNIAFDEIYRFLQTHNPKEIIINVKSCPLNKDKLISYLEIQNKTFHYIEGDDIDKNISKISYQKNFLEKVYKDKHKSLLTIHEFLDLENKLYGTMSFISLLQFAYEHNETVIQKIDKPKIWETNEYLILTNDSINQLNLIDYNNTHSNNKYNSLFGIINSTSTTLGKRYLKDKLLNPINNPEVLLERYQYIEELLRRPDATIDNTKPEYHYKIIEKYLNKIMDIERLHRRMSLKMLQPAEFSNLDIAYRNILNMLDLPILNSDSILRNLIPDSKELTKFRNFVSEYENLFEMEEIMKYNINTISNSFFKKGQAQELDILQDEISKINNYFYKIANKLSYYIEKGSDYVKLEFTDKDGYYLLTTKKRAEVMKKAFNNMSNKSFTIKINEIESISINPKELDIKLLKDRAKITSNKLIQLSYKLRSKQEEIKVKTTELYLEKLEYFSKKYLPILSKISKFIAKLDFYKSNAKTSIIYGYNKPNIDLSEDNSFIDSRGLRHPIIERIQNDIEYVPNDVVLGKNNLNGMLLYGCNAVGKSSLMKAVGLNLIMAQAGMYVAAESFTYRPFNYIFTRISDNDNIFKGQSSFAVEMSELRSILKRSDNRSIILGDELCSGTESISAQSIFAASVIKLALRNVNFIFATHLHELYKMPKIKELGNVSSFHLKVIFDERTKKLIYDRKLELGNGPTIYGLEVCKAMDLDESFLELANDIRKNILNIETNILEPKQSQYNSNVYVDLCRICLKKATETHHIKEQQTADSDEMIGAIHKNVESNLVPLCEECHLKVHHGNLEIYGYKETTEGKMLDFEFIEKTNEFNKSKKKFNDEQVKKIKSYQDKNISMSRAVILLEEKEKIKVSQNTLKKIWQDKY